MNYNNPPLDKDNEPKNPIFNKKVPLDSNLLMNILMQMINCHQTSCIGLPEFRVDQLINLAIKCIIPIAEKKILDSICSIYILCLYYGLSTQYYHYNTCRFMSILQLLLSESINVMFNFTNHCILMPPIISTLVKSEHIETEHMLEIFLESLEIGKAITREFYKLMKVTLRIGQNKYTPSSVLSTDERRIQMKHNDCIQPYSIYFMCTFAYSHIVIVLKSNHCLNIYPGSCECFLALILTKYEEKKKSSKLQATTTTIATNTTPATLTMEIEAAVELQATVDVCMRKAYQLALFVAHVIFEERCLQELRLTHARIIKYYQHPNITFAKYCTSKIKDMLLLSDDISGHKEIIDDSSKVITSNVKSSHKTTKSTISNNNTNNSSKSNNNKNEKISDILSSNSNLLDPMQDPNYHFYKDKESVPSLVPSWQYYDPNDEDIANINMMNLHISNKKDNISYEDTAVPSSTSMKTTTTAYNNNNNITTTTSNNNNNHSSNISNTKQTNQTKTNALGNNNNNNNNNKSTITIAQKQKIDQYWSLGKIFRTPYVLLDTFQTKETNTTTINNNINNSNTNHAYYTSEYHPAVDSIFHSKIATTTINSNNKTSNTTKSDVADDNLLHQYHLLKLSKEHQISLLPLTTAIKVIEAQYYEYTTTTSTTSTSNSSNSSTNVNSSIEPHLCHRIVPIPRCLNPTTEVYWIVVYIIDFLHRQTCKGFGFHPPPQLELLNLKKQIKHSNLSNRYNNITNHNNNNITNNNNNNITNNTNNTTTIQLQQLRKSNSMHNDKLKDPYHKVSNTTATNTTTSTTMVTTSFSSSSNSNNTSCSSSTINKDGILNLQQRLQIAANEAAMETKADKLNAQILNHSNNSNIKTIYGDEYMSDTHTFEQDFNLDQASIGSDVIQSHNTSSAAIATMIPSIVWTCKPKLLIARKGLRINIEDEDDLSEITLATVLKGIRKEDKKNYADKIKQMRKEQKDKENNLKQYYIDLKETVLSKIRIEKSDYIRSQREALKNELQAKMLNKKEWLQYKEQQERNDLIVKLRLQQEQEEKDYQELLHIKELKLINIQSEKNKNIEYQKIINIEKLKINKLINKKEIDEIKRMLLEEEQMKYCEQLRKRSEDRIALDIAMKDNQLKMIQLKAAELRDKLQARIRKGNFLWHHGKYGYYDNVRSKAIEWVQYEDSEGVAYYYDPVTKTSQYRIPADADYHHFTEDERKSYDAIHGDGAYDAYSADVAFKQGVNRDGGYWDPIQGLFVIVNGHYDENGDFIADEGYYDDRGRYRLFAKVNGDLSFMV